MINFLKETRDFIENLGYKTEDILFITNLVSNMTWEEFEKEADFEYTISEPSIWEHIKIVGKDWWLSRELLTPVDLVDGGYLEYWKYNEFPKKGEFDDIFPLHTNEYLEITHIPFEGEKS